MKTLLSPLALAALALTACQPLSSLDDPDEIPVTVQGRWGLTANDCDPARDDNKGLMVITANELTFYEARATLAAVQAVDATRIEGRFDFTGEGQNWAVDMSLDAKDNGAVLIRKDYTGSDTPGPLHYTRCAEV